MTLSGKGFFIWKIPSCENGNAASIALQAQTSNLSHVLIKIADGTNWYNYDTTKKIDLIAPVASALKSKSIKVWGWHYVYGYDPINEARKAVQRLNALNLDGYVIDAEVQYKESGKAAAAKSFMAELRRSLPDFPIALSSYRYPSYHSALPWKEFLNYCDYSMPQVYWEQAHNTDVQLTKCVSEYKTLVPYRPIIPTGPAYKVSNWTPTDVDIRKFLNTAKSLGLSGVNFFSWDECRSSLNALWKLIGGYSWSPAPPIEFHELFLSALNTRNVETISTYYHVNAVQITPSRTIQGIDLIKNYYTTLFSQTIPGAVFAITGVSGTGTTRHITWRCTSTRGSVSDGDDTFGLADNKILYHYSNYSTPR